MKKNQTSAFCPSGHSTPSFNSIFKSIALFLALLVSGGFAVPLKAFPPCGGITVDVTGSGPGSCGACDGSASATPSGGVEPYTYIWSTGATTQSIGGQTGGTHVCLDAGVTTAGHQFIAANGDTFKTDNY